MSAHVLDRHQQAAADPAASVWVAASAGTGKTHVLTNRVLRLMLAGSEPGKILCLTFTRAAAAEMANRLHQRLGQWATMTDADLGLELEQLCERAPDQDHLNLARQLFARVLDVPGGLKIQTIHAFCQSLLARFPLEAGLPTNFQVMDERSSAELMAAAVDSVLAGVAGANDSALAVALDAVLRQIGEFGFQKLLKEFSSKRGTLHGLLTRHGGIGPLTVALRQRLGLAADDTEQTILAAAVAPGLDGANLDEAGLRAAAGALMESKNKNDSARGAAIADWLGAPDKRLAGFADYSRIFLTKELAPRKTLITKPVQEKFPAEAEALAAEALRLMEVTARRKMVAVAEATEALLILGGAVAEAFAAAKLRHAMLDYDDLILTTSDLLLRPGVAPWVLYKLDGGLDHILIDEAQDTSPEQWQVIAALAGEFFAGLGAREQTRTVFAVGDLKQSIFSFQGADPRSFGDMREYFHALARQAEVPFGPIPLELSFRSTEAVLGLVDEVFAVPEARDGLTLDNKPIRHVAHRAGQAGLVELWPLVKTEAHDEDVPWTLPVKQHDVASAGTQLARHIARTIKGWIGRELLEAQDRTVRPGDVLVLLRRRGDFAGQLVKALKQENVPVAGADRMMLTEQLGVMDLMALGRFVLLPGDDLNLAVVLKGPLFGLDDDDLFQLAHGREGTLWRALVSARDGDERFARAHDELARLMGEADFMPPYEFFSTVLGAGGGRRRLLARLGPEAEDAINEFLNLALDHGRQAAPSLEGFLHWIGATETEVKRDMEQGGDEVRVMTVHGAKGLQAPIVILPDTTQKPRARPALLTLAGGGEAAADEELFVWPVAGAAKAGACARARAAADLRDDQEYRRLLYVALTRARDRLYICGWETSRRRAAGCWYDLVAEAFERLGAVEEVEGELGAVKRFANAQRAQPEDTTSRHMEAGAAVAGAALPAWAETPAPAEADPPRPLTPSRPRALEPAVLSPFLGVAPGQVGAVDGADGGAALARGQFVHRLLEILPGLAPKDQPSAARAYLEKTGRDLTPEAREVILGEILTVLALPTLTPLFGPGSLAEVPLAGVVDGHVVRGLVDRLIVTDDEVLVLDYKTNRHPPGDVQEVPEIYLNQMAAYRALLLRIFPDRNVRCAILWTDGPLMMPLPDALLDRPLR